MAFLDIDPPFRAFLAGQGLVAPTDFLDLPGVLVGGHADRSVARIVLGEGPQAITAFLKRQYRVRWRERIASAWMGLGFVSRSFREAVLLRQLQQANVPVPQVIAAGEVSRTHAFLLVRGVAGAVDLRRFLFDAEPATRRKAAVEIGRAVGHLHAAGFDHPDLYSKHVLVKNDSPTNRLSITFLDWQRSRRRSRVPWKYRCRDLAALDATVADNLVSPRDRLACLRAYCRQLVTPNAAAEVTARLTSLRQTARAVGSQALRLLRRRRIRELRHVPMLGEQQLVRLNGEPVCVTPRFRDELQCRLPGWLRLPDAGGRSGMVVMPVPLSSGVARQATLTTRRVRQPLGWLWNVVRGRPLVSAELENAGTLFRLERYGICAPRLLAFGQRFTRPWRTESLLLTEQPSATIPIEAWLASHQEQPLRRRLWREVGNIMRRLHAAACYLGANPEQASLGLHVERHADNPPRLVVAAVGSIWRCRRPTKRRALDDVKHLFFALGQWASTPDALPFLLAYLDIPRLTPEARRAARHLLRAVVRGRRRAARQRAAV
jgi:tRNA A-37 threonylcarbamoyl transferase component Bud32